MKSIDFLEHGGASTSRPFAYRLHGYDWPMEDPREQHYQWVLMALHFGCTPAIARDIPGWQRDLVFDRWRAAWNLPEFTSAQRLAYLVDHYRPAIAHDIATRTRYDLGDLWRERRWTLLLDILDRLPAHSQYASTVSMDEEHARMMAESLAARRESGDETPSGPPLTTWTPEVAVLTSVLDAVRHVSHTVAAVNSEKAIEPPPPAPRPVTPLESAIKRAEYERRKAAHEALVARVLPKKE